MDIISSLQNPKIKQAIKLREAKERKKLGLVIIEGWKELSLALAAGVEIEHVFYCPELDAGKKAVAEAPAEKNIIVSKKVFQKISYREHPDGVLAAGKIKLVGLAEIKLKKNPLIIVLEAVEKPGNLGAILRSADAAGADAVIICDKKTDIFSPNVIRASLGTVFTNKVIIADSDEAIGWLKENGIKIFATAPAAEKIYTDADFRAGAAIVMGAEDKGLSEKWFRATDEKIKIPMAGKIDSLNVSVSLAIILFEALRQRNN